MGSRKNNFSSQQTAELVSFLRIHKLSGVHMSETTTSPKFKMSPKAKRFASTGALMGMVAIFSTGCTVEEILSIARIIGFFI